MVGDAELAVAAASGDRFALADIYDRYADSLYELCRAVLSDTHEANDAVHDTFVIASTHIDQLRDPGRLKPWLFAIVRRESIRRSGQRARMRPSHDEVLDVPVLNDTASGARSAAALVWEAANALTDRDRALLVLNVRHGFEGADLADAAGLPGAQASVALRRAETELASAVCATSLIRNGRTDCADLASIAPRAHHALDGLTRKRVERHARGCASCQPKWNATPDALGILAAAPLLGAPAALRNEVLDDAELIDSSHLLGAGRWRHDGFPPGENPNRRRPMIVSLAAGLIAMVVAAGLVLAGNDASPTRSAIDTRGETGTTTLPTAVDAAETTLVADGVTTPTSVKRTTSTRRGGATTTAARRVQGGPAPTTAPTVPPTSPPTAPPTFRITRTDGPGAMSACESGTFTAFVEGAGPTFLFLTYSSGNSQNSVAMQRNGDRYTTRLQIENPGQYTWRVSGGGATSTQKSLTITECGAQPQ